jgi:Apea-like HEPN
MGGEVETGKLAFRSALSDDTRAALELLGRLPAADLRLGNARFSPAEDDPESLLYPDPSGQCAGVLHSRRRPIHEQELHDLPEYARLAEVVSRDSLRHGVVGSTVSSGGRGRRIYLSDLTDGPLINMVWHAPSLEFAEDAFDHEFERLDAMLCDSDVEHSKLVPLLRFYCPVAGDIRLDDEITISVMTPSEQRQCAVWGYGLGLGKRPFWCVRFRRRLPKHVGDDYSEMDEDEALRFSSEALSFNTDAPDAIVRAITALRLLKEGPFSAPGLLDESAVGYNDFGGSTTPFFGDSHTGMESYALAADEFPRLVSFWNRHKDNMRSPLVAYSLARFSICGEAQRPEERLVNLAICAESLLLTPHENAELTHRMALRGAFLLENEHRPRETVYRFLKRAYAARSRVVHGSELSTAGTKSKDKNLTERLDGTNDGLRGLLVDFADLLRELLGIALDLVPENRRLTDEADGRIYGR